MLSPGVSFVDSEDFGARLYSNAFDVIILPTLQKSRAVLYIWLLVITSGPPSLTADHTPWLRNQFRRCYIPDSITLG